MKAGSSRQYLSTRFVVLSDAESIAKAKKNYFMWIIIVTLLFCITGAYLYYKIFIDNTYSRDQNSESSTKNITLGQEESKYSKLYNLKPLLAGFRKRTSKSHWEVTCEGSELQTEIIPAIFIREIVDKNFEDAHDYINIDLLLHYEYIINKYRAETLNEIFNEYHLKLSLLRNSRDFINFLRVLKSNKFKFYAGYLKAENLKIKNFESVFLLTEELNYWYNYLTRLRVFLSSYDQQKSRKYFVICTAENFAKFTEDTHLRLFRFAYAFHVTDKKLQEINEIINEWAEPVRIVYENSSIVFYGKVLLLSKINREMGGLNVSHLKSAYFFASHIIYLDEHVELLGVDLAIIAPKWVFLRKIKINLNGTHGRNATGGANSNQPGKPGSPGGNAGDFLGIGNPQEKFLLVSADGGNGGSGQNGAKGQDGVNNTRPDPPFDKPACTTKVHSFKNAFGEVITHHKIYNPSGCGGSGTDGGVAGEGGAGGVITLISESSTNVKRGWNGTTGLPGKGGAGGVGGRDGCFYEALDVDDEILHRVTRVKCQTGNVLPSGEPGKDGHNIRGQIFPPAKDNLKAHKCLLRFILYAGGNFNYGVISLLKHFNRLDVEDAPDVEDIVLEYKSLAVLDRIEFYDLFNEQIDNYLRRKSPHPILTYLKSIVLGRMTILKENINYFYIDLKNYLNILKRDIKATNENTRDLHFSIYLKKRIDIKREAIKCNLQRIRSRLIAEAAGSERNFYTNCIMMRTIDVLQLLLNRTLEVKHLELIDLFMLCSIKFNVRAENSGKTLTKGKLTNDTRNLFEILENLRSKRDVRENLLKLKDGLCSAGIAEELTDDEKKIHEALNDEIERIIALYCFIEWEGLENSFLKSLHDLPLNTRSDSKTDPEVVEFLKTQLFNVIVGLQYRLAVDAATQNLYPSSNTNTHLQILQNGSLIEDVLTQITLFEDNANGWVASLCKNHLKAVFDENSAVGEFYFWPNAEIKNELRTLFSGTETDLKSNLINRHVLDKHYVQFVTLKFEFECSQVGCQEQINGILANFKIQITHSGYSYYNWKGETNIVVSEKVTLEYTFRMRDNKEHEIYNALYKKCQDGEIKLSPFTTWTLRLLPINEEADFDKLLSFADNVNVRLTGSGTYAS